MNAKTLAKQLARKLNIPRSRRGSVLVLIVGVLAMVALLVLVYSTLGQADRRGAASLAARIKLSDQAGTVRDYFSRVIADSAFNYSYQRTQLQVNGRPRDLRLRAVYDYPSTDPEFRSTRGTTPVADFEPRKFSPTGQVNGPWRAADDFDPRMATGQPWLAASEPSWILPNASDNQSFTDSRFPSRDFNGWAHISNFAPSGNFVNLYMLRENTPGGGSEPGRGFNVTSGVPVNNEPRFSSKLTLRDPADVSQLSQRLAIGGTATQRRADGQNALLNRPADWSTNQAGVIANVESSGGDPLGLPGQPGHIWSEWADTDGDGLADARFFEFVDVSDPANPVSVLSLDPNYRWVFAARAIDLSGRVNVNTAVQNFATLANGNLDGATLTPTPSFPLGLTPSEVSLRLLLESPWIYDGNTESNYGNLAPTAIAPRYATDYDDVANARRFGAAAFSGAMFTRLQGVVPDRSLPTNPGDLPPRGPTGNLPDLRDIIERDGTRDVLTRRGLANIYKLSQDPEGGTLNTAPGTVAANDDVPVRISAGSAFSLADLLELLTFNGANDNAINSRLEQALDGRAGREVGPLRSNRDRDAEIAPRSFSDSNADRALEARTQAYSDIRSRLTTISGARPLGARIFVDNDFASDDAIGKFTDNDLRPDIGSLVSRALATEPAELGFAPTDWQSLYTERQKAANDLLIGYARALMPFAALRDTTDANSAETPWARGTGRSANANRIQSYAFGSPLVPAADQSGFGANPTLERNSLSTVEISLRRAAHMVLNLIASRDTDDRGRIVARPDSSPDSARSTTTPRVVNDEVVGATIIFNGNALTGSITGYVGDGVAQISGNNLAEAFYTSDTTPTALFPFGDPRLSNSEARDRLSSSPAFMRGHVFNLDHRITGPTGQSLDTRTISPETPRPVTIYAVKPQPFITSAVAMISYSDVPDATGSVDAVPNPDTGEFDPLNIRGDVTDTNADFLFQMAIITISNPFETDIDLSSDKDPGTGNLESDYKYYIEFGGRYYKLLRRNFSDAQSPADGRIVLRAKESIDFFILSHDPDEIRQRLSKFPNSVISQADVRKLIIKQLREFNGFSPPSETDEAAFSRFRLRPSNLENDGRVPGIGSGDKVALLASQRSTLEEPFASMYSGGSAAKDLDRQVRLWRAFRAAEGDGVSPLVNEKSKNATGNDILVDRLRDAVDPSEEPTLTVALDSGTNEIEGTISGPEPTGGGSGIGSDNRGYTITLYGAVHRPRERAARTVPAFPAWAVESKTSLNRARGYETGKSSSLRNYTDIVANRDEGGEIRPTASLFNESSAYAAHQLKDWLNKLSGNPNSSGNVRSPTQLVNTNPKDATGSPNATIDLRVGSEDLADSSRALFSIASPSFGFDSKSIDPTNIRDSFQLPPLGPTDALTPLAFGPSHDPLRLLDQRELPTGAQFPSQAADNPRHPANLDVQWTTLSEALASAVDVYSPARVDDPDYFAGNPLYGSLSGGRIPTRRFVPFHDTNNNGRFDQITPGTANLVDPHVGSGIPFGLDIVNQFRTTSVGSTVLPVPGVVNINTASRTVMSTLPFFAVDHDPRAKFFYGNDAANYAGKRDIAAYAIAYRDKTRAFIPTQNAWVDYRDTRAGTANDIATGDDAGRRNTTAITALREAPGFQSLAEVLAATVATRDASDPLALNGFTTPVVNGYGMDTNIASTMLATASVRSDTFAVWFTMDGYRESDTQGLEITDPLVPTIRKRYVMVVDRSNVTEKGQSPRVLLFRELPTE
jgi:hypothetical protein